jgi:hypothetical protein
MNFLKEGNKMIEYAIYSWLFTAVVVIGYLWFCKPKEYPND